MLGVILNVNACGASEQIIIIVIVTSPSPLLLLLLLLLIIIIIIIPQMCQTNIWFTDLVLHVQYVI